MFGERDEERWHRLLGDCAEALGTHEFIGALLEIIEIHLAAAQCMVFGYDRDGATCLLSMNFRARAHGQHLAKNYREVGHGSDPLVAILKGMNGKAAQEQVIRLCDVIDTMPTWYLETFYRKPGLRDKVAVLLADNSGRMIVNFYYHDPVSRVEDDNALLSDSYYLLAARLVRAHFSRNTDVVSAGPLSILSDRERQVCEGVLAGLKSEMIAADVGISPNSVVTYRKRAYSKLGINSRADLFALCRR